MFPYPASRVMEGDGTGMLDEVGVSEVVFRCILVFGSIVLPRATLGTAGLALVRVRYTCVSRYPESNRRPFYGSFFFYSPFFEGDASGP